MILDDLLDFIEQKRILLAASALKEFFFFFHTIKATFSTY